MNKTIVLFPGGFKPLTGAHLALANRYAQSSNVERVIMLIGPKERDSVSRKDTAEIFNLINSNPKIVMQPTDYNSPIMAAYEYLFALPETDNGTYAMAASKKGDDYARTMSFGSNVEKYKTVGDKGGRKMPAGIKVNPLEIDVDPLAYADGTPISASTVRKAIAEKDYETFAASYPGTKEAIVKNIWQMLTGVQESVFSKNWWGQQLSEDIDEVIEGYQTPKMAKAHDKKIKKLKKFLDKSRGKEFVYDFNNFSKTVFGAPIKESLITEGGAGGHMNHPYDAYGLTFNDMKEIVSRALEGRLDIEQEVTEKTDGQNIQVTWKNGEPGFARGVKTVRNPMTTSEIIASFEEKYQKIVDESGADAAEGYKSVVEAYTETAADLTSALSKLSPRTLQSIFKNGRVFANMEIIYPATKNIIAYETAVLQFHNLVEYDESGKVVQTDLAGGTTLQKVIQDANAHLQKTFSFIPPNKMKLGQIEDFEDKQNAFFAEIDSLRNQFGLKETDTVSEYHKAWWKNIIQEKANQLGYDITDEVIELLTYRWAFGDKSTSITKIKKLIDNDQFAEWVSAFDKKDFKLYRKQNIQPFESIFLRLGAVVLKNIKNYLAANPNAAVQDIKRSIANLTKQLQTSDNIETINKLETELKKIEQIGGFDTIVPIEGIVFTYGGNTYKLTGSFAPVNQILGVLKYAR
jgi:prefoldin subunit 5